MVTEGGWVPLLMLIPDPYNNIFGGKSERFQVTI